MPVYRATFVGRLRNAIGLSYRCEVLVAAPDVVSAPLVLYETHEDIQHLVLEEVTSNGTQEQREVGEAGDDDAVLP